MLLSALVVGAGGAIGSTYNVAAPLYQRIIASYESGDLQEARRLQFRAVQMVRTIYRYPFHAAMKQILKSKGIDCGCCRLPQRRLTTSQIAELNTDLEQIGFFDW
jgi:N-acetylneuraminate lyase